MFHAAERLPHLLSPKAYWSVDDYSREISSVFSRSWHFVGLQSELAHPGDFVTVELCGIPIQVRNIEGQIHAISNVCAHRHCLLTSLRRGTSEKLQCQYHGWEYAASGEARRIPQAQHFTPLNRTSIKIPIYRVETVGPLVFVNLQPAAPSLKDDLGESFETLMRGFGGGWEVTHSAEFPQPVNWKIPIENSLEAYHVPSIHPETFRADPGEGRSEHRLSARGSSFETTLPFATHSATDDWFQRVEGRILKMLTGITPTATYQQHHIFPNILFSLTDMTNLLHVVRPTGAQTCTSIIYQFGRMGKSSISRLGCRLWGRMSVKILLGILKEDFGLYPDIQRGLVSSQNGGMLGRCEERIHHFQRWLKERQSECDLTNRHSTTALNGTTREDCPVSSFCSRLK
jgi:choline monooxygenase